MLLRQPVRLPERVEGGGNPNDGWGNPELGAVDSPIGDYKYPLATFVIFYILYTLYFKNRRHI